MILHLLQVHLQWASAQGDLIRIMAVRTKTQFKALYGTSGTLFPDNTTAEISEADVRSFGEDIADSFVNEVAPTGAIWGTITGTLSAQTDLQTAIDNKVGNGINNGVTTIAPSQDVVFDAFAQEVIDRNAAIAAAQIGLWDDRGSFSAAGGAYPTSANVGSGTAGAILKGDIWTISVAGTLPTGQVVEVGDVIRALIDTPGNTQANWAILQNNIGYVAENAANKVSSISASTTQYPNNNGVIAYMAPYIIDLATPSTAGGTITLDMVSQVQRMFVGSASFGTAKAIALSNTTNSLVLNLVLTLTNVAAVLTFPSTFTMQASDTRWNDGAHTFTPSGTGKHEFSATWDGTDWNLKVTYPYA